MMKNTLLFLAVLALFLGFTGCVPEATVSLKPDTPEEPGGIPDDFDWNTTEAINLTVIPDDEYDAPSYYTVEVFVGNPAIDTDAALVSGGKANASEIYKAQVVIPKEVSTIYVRQTDPYQKKRLFAFEVTSPDMICNLNGDQSKAHNAKTKSPGNVLTKNLGSAYAIPAVDYTLPGNVISLKKNDPIKSGKSYLIGPNTQYNIRSLPGEGNFSLYIQGKAYIENDCQFNTRTKVYILDGGELIGREGVQIELIGTAQIAVAPEGQLGDEDLKFELTGTSRMINEGEVDLSWIEMNANATLYNKGEFSVEVMNINNQTNVIVNTHEFEIDHTLALTNGVIWNGCYFSTKKCNVQGGQINLATGSLFESEKMESGGLSLNMEKHSILYCDNLQFSSWPNTITGTGDDYALIRAKNIELDTWGLSVQYTGKVEIEAQKHTANGEWNIRYKLNSPACFADGKASVTIAPCECNDNTGNQGEGESTPDTNPEYEEQGTLAYTYFFEDNWPVLGDYDMNDLVLRIQINNLKKASQTVGFKYITTVLAVGGQKTLAAGFQLDDISATNVDGSESDQSKAVYMMFKDAHALFGESNGFINSYQLEKEPITLTETIRFKSPNDRVVNVNNFNLFIVWGNLDIQGRNEIHQPGYSGTDKAAVHPSSVNYKYKYIENSNNSMTGSSEMNNMMWALKVPSKQAAHYPKEGRSITLAYPMFDNWVKTGGNDNEYLGWYNHPDASNVVILGN